jgi:molybdate transport system substrate-binding protein
MSLQIPLSKPADYNVSRRRRGATTPVPAIAALALAAAVVGAQGSAAQEPALRVLASNGVKAALEQLQPEIDRHARSAVAISFGTSASTKQRIAAGDAFDVAILTSDVIDELVAAGRVVAASRAPLGRSGIGVGMRSGAKKPDIGTPDALKRALLSARSMTWASDGASRPHITKMLEMLGIADAVTPKILLEQGSVRAAARVTGGDADFIITLISEIVPVPGLELVGPLPATFQNYVSFAAGIGAKARNVEGARAVIAFLSSQSASPAFAAKGIER